VKRGLSLRLIVPAGIEVVELMAKPSTKWRRIQPIYQYFAGESEVLDFSDDAAVAMFLWESRGEGDLRLGLFQQTGDKYNGYAVGKHWMDVTVAMWNTDIRERILCRYELYEEFPDWHWWLDRVLN